MSLDNAISDALRGVELADSICKSKKVNFTSLADKLAFTCFDLVIEHGAAITLLVESKLFGSSKALVRPQFEAFVRGLWLKYDATDIEIQNFQKGQVQLPFKRMLSRVEPYLNEQTGILSDLQQRHWKNLCDFTHSGSLALTLRVGNTTTGHDNYHEDNIKVTLGMCGAILNMVTLQLSSYR